MMERPDVPGRDDETGAEDLNFLLSYSHHICLALNDWFYGTGGVTFGRYQK